MPNRSEIKLSDSLFYNPDRSFEKQFENLFFLSMNIIGDQFKSLGATNNLNVNQRILSSLKTLSGILRTFDQTIKTVDKKTHQNKSHANGVRRGAAYFIGKILSMKYYERLSILRDLALDPTGNLRYSPLKSIVGIKAFKAMYRFKLYHTRKNRVDETFVKKYLSIFNDPAQINDPTVTWLTKKLNDYIQYVGKDVLKAGGFGKLVRVMTGTLLYCKTFIKKGHIPAPNMPFDTAVKVSYCFGVSYLYDDLLDSNELDQTQKRQIHKNVIAILTEKKSSISEIDAIGTVGDEILYDCLFFYKALLPNQYKEIFFAYYVIAMAQRMEKAVLAKSDTFAKSNILALMSLKAAFTRVILNIIIGAEISPAKFKRIILIGLINQFLDDLRDARSDIECGNETLFSLRLMAELNGCHLHPLILYFHLIDFLSLETRVPAFTRFILLVRFVHGLKRYKSSEDMAPLFFNIKKNSIENNKLLSRISQLQSHAYMIKDLSSSLASQMSNISIKMRKDIAAKIVIRGH